MSMLYLRNKVSGESCSSQSPEIGTGRSGPMKAIALALLVALAGCANAPSESVSPESMKARAIARSTERWKALTDKRFSDVYEFLSVGSRVGTTAQEYAEAMSRMGYIRAEIESAECDRELCTVRSSVTLPIYVRNVGARPQSVPVVEKWTWSKGDLWLIRN